MDGDEIVLVLSVGYFCYVLWKGKIKFNFGGSLSYVREYKYVFFLNLLEGCGI